MSAKMSAFSKLVVKQRGGGESWAPQDLPLATTPLFTIRVYHLSLTNEKGSYRQKIFINVSKSAVLKGH